jgi:hypothetical protein
MNSKALAVRKSGRTLKTLLTAIVVFASMITGMAQVPSYLPTNGLVGWWPFNSNANDESGNGNNGTVNGATLTADRNGNANAAYSFDGVNDFIIASGSSQLSTNQKTISFWVNFNASSGVQEIICLGDQTSTTWGCIASNGVMVLNYGRGCTNNPSQPLSINLTNANWHQLVFVSTGVAGTTSMYFDGQFVGSANTASSVGSCSNANLYFGVDIFNSPEYFDGLLDDIGIWNRTLTQQEITNLYTSSTPPPCNPLAANLMNGLVGYWPFCGNANDESGNGNNGTVNGATLTGDRFGNVDAAYSFDGNGDYIDCGNNSSLNLSNSFTISAWVNGNTFAQEKGIVSKSQGATPYTYDLIVSNNGGQKVRFDINQNYLFSNQNLNTNNWYNIVATYNGSIQSIYIDGVLSSSQNVSTILSSVADHLLLGAHQVSVVPSWSWDGKLDDIAIWNRALTQNEITQLYTGSPCVNYQVITVTDTLVINANLTGVSPVTFQNSIKVYPNPSSTQITIDFGSNYTTMAGYTMRIQNAVGQTVYTTGVTQQQFTSNLSTWTGNGIYFVYLIDAQGNTVDVKKIILQ